MSEEQLKAFLEKLKADTSLQEKLKGAKNFDEVISIAKESGYEFTADALDQSLQLTIDKANELSDQELENVVGGQICVNKTRGIFKSILISCGDAAVVSNDSNYCPQYSMGGCG